MRKRSLILVRFALLGSLGDEGGGGVVVGAKGCGAERCARGGAGEWWCSTRAHVWSAPAGRPWVAGRRCGVEELPSAPVCCTVVRPRRVWWRHGAEDGCLDMGASHYWGWPAAAMPLDMPRRAPRHVVV